MNSGERSSAITAETDFSLPDNRQVRFTPFTGLRSHGAPAGAGNVWPRTHTEPCAASRVRAVTTPCTAAPETCRERLKGHPALDPVHRQDPSPGAEMSRARGSLDPGRFCHMEAWKRRQHDLSCGRSAGRGAPRRPVQDGSPAHLGRDGRLDHTAEHMDAPGVREPQEVAGQGGAWRGWERANPGGGIISGGEPGGRRRTSRAGLASTASTEGRVRWMEYGERGGGAPGAPTATQELDSEIGSHGTTQVEGSLSGGKRKHWIKEVTPFVFIITLWTPRDR